MPGVPPPPDFGRAKLEIETIPPGRTFGRIYWSTYPDPLGYGKSASRFSDLRRRVAANRFGVLYLGDSLKVCFLETVLRDRREGLFDDLPIEEVELTQRRYAEITTTAELRLIDLRGDNAVRMGVPTDVVRAQRQNLARRWSVAFHEHSSRPDGIIYPSRLNGATNLAIYDHSIAKLQPKRILALLGALGLAQVLEDFRIGLA
ncbi:RES family NAD+ phosphorylase [Mesorhizobium sp.]|uniref:RES family NAD+ phosphorylase n=1 Tax=Mesorhizobium sp. TaxID=1871066 RepID=UPI000FE41BCA|nr:RES family NAD+ phosphorylase [Mesorhizobium sp.]RWN94782.1 MAG: RES domain-containing protein [Mesorhizobium sp.]RWO19618.1 MAG: RES domain-containing protein [Mesorhizobium sp.]TIL84746.1 MAG: RES domain-containing protein [Mesorhizobium sp.]TIN74254.1 MAG: RES domain-containing protein [Mesorhizobium sp.]TIS29547.1 MAG: RES domain-containing protein [Mesorhizobium sp.]